MKKETLWTRDFTILTLGSMVSMLGNAMTGFAISLFVLDYTESTFLYALYVFLYTLPQIAAPILAGPLMDRFSRRKTIYLLDFLSAGLYGTMGVVIWRGEPPFSLLAAATFLIGTVNSIYSVAFSSFYPLLIQEGNYSKAYSVSSTLETLSYVMLPVATLLYRALGISPLLMATGLCFLTAALFETQISDVERNITGRPSGGYGLRTYLSDSREGFSYLRGERGLLCVAAYFMVNAMAEGASSVITLPWFRANYSDGEFVYMSVWALTVVGRVAGGLVRYRRKIPAGRKLATALAIYLLSSLLEGGYLYTPLAAMRLACLTIGVLSITSYNIRVSSTQSYVPDEKKGRFNGAFLTLTTVGRLLGELLAGGLSNVMSMRKVLSTFFTVNGLAAILFIGGGRKAVAEVYNRDT